MAARAGWQLWQFLKPRLVLLVGMRRVWGQLDELYQSRAHSMFEEQPLPPYIIDPDSAFSMWCAMRTCAHAHTRTCAHPPAAPRHTCVDQSAHGRRPPPVDSGILQQSTAVHVKKECCACEGATVRAKVRRQAPTRGGNRDQQP